MDKKSQTVKSESKEPSPTQFPSSFPSTRKIKELMAQAVSVPTAKKSVSASSSALPTLTEKPDVKISTTAAAAAVSPVVRASVASSVVSKEDIDNDAPIKDVETKSAAAEQKNVSEKPKRLPVIEPTPSKPMVDPAVPRTRAPRPAPSFAERPLVLATHLVPSLPVGLFEVVAEAIEAACNRPCVIVHEARRDRPVAKEVVDIAILPTDSSWEDGRLLPIGFVFEHRLNKDFSPAVYADVVVATDRAPHVEELLDLRGHRCALPDRRSSRGVSALLFNYLRLKGEGPSFFGNTLDASSHVSALQMVAGKQVEVCVLESPVIRFHRKTLPGVYSLHILSSLGPLPPYKIFANKRMPPETVNKIEKYLLQIRQDTEWLEKFTPYSVLGFAEYSNKLGEIPEIKSVPTSAPYY
ncbi:uncharacterized protein LOC106656459 [Trichogramma pretiosum]|uniref:uncharacterized protein LOC106656459 n=1 Tax=Trichogramma pretiosum TaxID=7493 RepID=UPI0006C9AFD1|nr:uncharacterized protein LOC106656459 [Trichogramma pretiosum]